MNILRYAAFTDGPSGGNPAGVLLADALLQADEMQCIAAEIGYSETVFAAREADGYWRTRYFAPDAEVPFCGHATLALGAALAETVAPASYNLRLNQGEITVEARVSNGLVRAALQSPKTTSRPADETCVQEAQELFALNASNMDARIPPAIACAGATHLILGLASRNALSRAIPYDLERGRALMEKWGLGTICLVTATAERAFAVRNAFALGGVSEDPATGAAAAALAGYLRDLGWPHGNQIEIAQGDDMHRAHHCGPNALTLPLRHNSHHREIGFLVWLRSGCDPKCGATPPKARRKVGRLLRLAEEIAISEGLGHLSVIVASDNAGARRLYERHGFKQVERKACVKDGWDTATDQWLLLMKPLSRAGARTGDVPAQDVAFGGGASR